MNLSTFCSAECEMFRILVGMLAAFVGFSFGHSIPKWMEKRSRSATEMTQSPVSTHPMRKLPLRRKSLRKFKVSIQKSGKENLKNDESLQQLSKDNADSNGSSFKGPQNSPVCASARVRAEHKKFKFGSQKSLKEKSSFKVHDSSPVVPLSDVDVDNGSCAHQDASTIIDHGRRLLQETCTKSKIAHCPQQELCAEVVSPVESVFCKISSMQSMCGSPPAKEKSQMKQWKMKLMSLRSKAMASEKVWCKKFDNENYGGNLLVHTSLRGMAKNQAKGKENESPHLATSTKKSELSWSRSSSKVGLLVEGPKSAFER